MNEVVVGSSPVAVTKLKILNFTFYVSKKYFLVFIEIKHKIDLEARYFKLHLTTIKFPTQEISSEWGGGFTFLPHNIFKGIY